MCTTHDHPIHTPLKIHIPFGPVTSRPFYSRRHHPRGDHPSAAPAVAPAGVPQQVILVTVAVVVTVRVVLD